MKNFSGIFTTERKSRLVAVILLSLFLPFMVLVISPFEIYCNNIAELTFSANDFMLTQSLLALGVGVVLFLILFFVPEVVYRFLYPALLGILLMLFVQTNYLNGGLNSLAGDDLDSTKTSTFTYVWNTAVWVFVIAGVITAFQFVKINGTVRLVALVVTIAISATQLMNFTVTNINTANAYDSAIDRTYGKFEQNPRFLTYKDINTVADGKNVIFFCVDRLDAELYASPAIKRYPETFNKLTGFTYYSDATSMYGYTFPSVAYMMSGIEYDHDNHGEFFHKVYNDNQTLNTLHENGYNIHLYSEAYFDYANANDLPDYVANSVETSKDSLKTVVRRPVQFCWTLTKMSLYRSFPFLLKDAVGGMNSDTCNGFILYESDELEGQRNYSYDLKDVYDEVKSFNGNFKAKGDKNFTFIHVSGCHSAEYNENWKKTNKKDYVVSAKNSFELINTYLDNMRTVSPDVYRDSTIIIMADHGKVDERTKKLKKPMLSGLFVKPSGYENQPFRQSDAPVSISNVWATIFGSEGISYDKSVWGDTIPEIEENYVKNGTYPTRKFIWTRRNSNLSSYDAIVYEINGKASDFKSWKITSSTFHDHPLFAY